MQRSSEQDFLEGQNALRGQAFADEPSLLELESVVQRQSPMVLLQNAQELVAKNQLGQAKRVLTLLLEQSPHMAEALSLLGTIYLLADQPRAALQRLAHAAELQPTWAEVRRLCGEAAWRTGQADMAVMYLKSAIKLKPDWPEAITRLGEAELRTGELVDGFAHYEQRWQIESYRKTAPPIRLPHWDGQRSLEGRAIVVFAEQGLNELVQYVRYAELLAKRGARVIITCPIDFRALVETVPGVSKAVGFGEPLPPADYQIGMMSLPHLLGTALGTIPAWPTYMRAEEGLRRSWREHFHQTSRGRRKLGIVWAGYPGENIPHAATLQLSDLRMLWDVPDTIYYSLAIGDAAADIQRTSAPLIDLSSQLDSPDAFAAVTAELDGVIAVDTAAAHLAAAQGKPTYMLLNTACNFRWTGVSAQTPWYPSAAMYRQEEEGDWSVPITRLFRALGGRPPANPFALS